MKEYLHTLIAALLGKNPYRAEIEEMKSSYGNAVARVLEMDNSCKMIEKKIEEAEQNQNKAEELIGSYSTLVENYRERLSEKDKLIEQFREYYKRRIKEYQSRIEEYNQIIEEMTHKDSKGRDNK